MVHHLGECGGIPALDPSQRTGAHNCHHNHRQSRRLRGLLLRDSEAAAIAAVFEAISAALMRNLGVSFNPASWPPLIRKSCAFGGRDCVTLANMAVNHAVDTIQKATDYVNSRLALDNFMAEASAPIALGYQYELCPEDTPDYLGMGGKAG
jgi:hypothetical protein